MKKYGVCNTIGEVITYIGVVLFLFAVTLDTDKTEAGFLDALLIILIPALVIIVGNSISNIDTVEGMIISSLVVCGAFIYSISKKSGKTCKLCYNIKKRSGGYVNAYRECKMSYEMYIESLYDEVEER